MDIVIAGCGKIGTTVIESLSNEGHSVTAIDKSSDTLDRISDMYDVMTVCGNAADCDVLDEAAIDKAELFVAITDSDELNMLCCYIAKKMGAKNTIARIRTPGYTEKSLGFLRQHLDLSVSVNPDRLAAEELYNMLKIPSAMNVETFSRRNFEMIELKVREGSILCRKKLMELKRKFPGEYLIGVVRRGDQTYIPDGNFEILENDIIGITASHTEIHKLFKALGIMQRQVKSVLIVGASRTAYYLAKMLIAGGSNVTIVEKDRQRCHEVSEKLRNAVIIHGDGANQELLLEAGIENADAFVSLTGMDEENILLSYYANSKNVPKVITKINRKEFALISKKMGLETIISPKSITADIFIRYARALKNSLGSKIETLYKLMDGTVEALEFEAQNDPKYARIPLKTLTLKKNTLVAGIIRGRKIIIPMGDDYIAPGDKVVILTAGKRMNDLADIVK